jgi:membrane protein YdbS with pleckstrin-like domain
MSDASEGEAALTGEPPEWLSLDPGETVEWVGRPEFVSVISAIVWGIVFIPVFGIGLLIIVGSVLSVRNTDYVATSESLYVKKGVLSTSIESVGLDKIQNTEFRQSFLGKQFGYGTVDISTAGSEGAEISFSSVGDAREVRELISRLSNAAQRADRRGEPGEAGGGDEDGRPEDDPLEELLTELRATREAMERVEAQLRARPSRAAGSGSDDGTDEGAAAGGDAATGAIVGGTGDDAGTTDGDGPDREEPAGGDTADEPDAAGDTTEAADDEPDGGGPDDERDEFDFEFTSDREE